MRRSATQSPRLQRRRRRPGDEPLQSDVPQAHAGPPGQAPGQLGAPAHATAMTQRHEALLGLQAQHGNEYVGRLIAGQAEAAPPALAPQVWESDHGVYHIFPDDHPLDLGLVRDPKQEWPISQQLAKRLRPASDMLAGSATQVELTGGVAFKVALLLDVAGLMERAGGRELITAVLAGGHRLKIEFAADSRDPQAASPSDSELRPDGTLGPGSDVFMRYAPEPWMPADGMRGWEQRKPALDLAQALVAALPLLTGSAPSTREREPVAEGGQATGQDRLKQVIRLENGLRGAFGMPLRPEE